MLAFQSVALALAIFVTVHWLNSLLDEKRLMRPVSALAVALVWATFFFLIRL